MLTMRRAVLTIVSAKEDSIMLTMLPSGYNINPSADLSHSITECVGGSWEMLWLVLAPRLPTALVTGCPGTVPARAPGGGATQVRTEYKARPARPRPLSPTQPAQYNVISNRSGRRPRLKPPLAGHFDRVVISGAQSLAARDQGPIKKSLGKVPASA